MVSKYRQVALIAKEEQVILIVRFCYLCLDSVECAPICI